MSTLAIIAPMLAARQAGTWQSGRGFNALARRAARLDERIDLANEVATLLAPADEIETTLDAFEEAEAGAYETSADWASDYRFALDGWVVGYDDVIADDDAYDGDLLDFEADLLDAQVEADVDAEMARLGVSTYEQLANELAREDAIDAAGPGAPVYGDAWSPECFGFGFTVSDRPAGSVGNPVARGAGGRFVSVGR